MRCAIKYRALWRHGLEGPLNYYRASPLRPPLTPADAIHTLAFAPEIVTVRVPTTVLWGDADLALPPSLLDGLEAFVDPLDVRRGGRRQPLDRARAAGAGGVDHRAPDQTTTYWPLKYCAADCRCSRNCGNSSDRDSVA